MTVALWRGEGVHLHALAESLRAWVTSRIAVETAELLLNVATPGHLALTSLALGIDGTVGVAEAWLLHRGQRWAVWLVIVVSSAPIPWEVYELFTHFGALRLILLIVNAAVVTYLVRSRAAS